MSTIEKFGVGIIGVALITTLILPGRQTVPVLKAAGSVFQGSLFTAITGKK